VLTRRGGWTLHEMLISLAVMGGVFAIVAHQAATQIRLYSGAQQAATAQENRAQAQAIAERLLWSLAPKAGDVVVAQDSALQIRMEIGSSVVCSSTPGSVTLASSTARGRVAGAMRDAPDAGDELAVLYHDSLGTSWLTVRVASAPTTAPCVRFPAESGLELRLVESLALPAGTAVRLLRPLRLSIYRASDSKWYLGAREWIGETARFNSIQPVAGPYAKYDAVPERSGLAFVYRAVDGQRLSSPVDVARIASISIMTRAPSTGAPDSGVVSITLRNQ
jgi:hypothetical protein